jgi:predicted short-subunit dehydrogenase-like oxidoreductase (DUF2520 family)
MKTLNIIGAGRVGRTLAALWQQHSVFAVGAVCNRTRQSAQTAIAFIGAGTVAGDLSAMPPADAWMVSTTDNDIAHAAVALAASGLLRAGDVVFHCSGALASDVLRTSLMTDVRVASVHPLKSFADPQTAVRTFSGTYCTAEGEAAALAVLLPAFEKIGARVSAIDAQSKTLYHAASVMVCNYLTALMEAGLKCYEKAGLPRATASAMMEPLVRETVDNLFKLGTVNALTGPIARGDHAVVARQLAALRAFDPRIAEIYRALGVMAVELSRAQGGASETVMALLHRTLSDDEGVSRQ